MRDNEFLEYTRETLQPFGLDKIRPMFGGFGLYYNEVMFALIADNELYFKADGKSAQFFKESGSEPFSYESKGRRIKMSYWKVLPEVLEDSDTLKTWYDMAYGVASDQKKTNKRIDNR